MNRVQACFFCVTPYHVMTAVNLTMSMSLEADLYVLNHFRGSKEIADNAKLEHIFRKVKWYDDTELRTKLDARSRIGAILLTVWYYITAGHIAKSILIPDTYYEEMFVAWKTRIPRIVRYWLTRKQKSLNVNYFDDGEGAYDNPTIYRTIGAERIVARLLFGAACNETNLPTYLYSPELYTSLHPNDQDLTLYKIEGMANRPAYKEIIDRIFDYKGDGEIAEKVILLDTIHSEVFDLSDHDSLNDIYQIIFDYLGTQEILIKRHPRDTSKFQDGLKYFKHNHMPFELICLNNDMKRKVLIAYASTSASTAKLLFDQEPFVIMLYKLVKNGTVNAGTDKYYHACKCLYKDSDRFLIPENKEELIQALERAKAEII